MINQYNIIIVLFINYYLLIEIASFSLIFCSLNWWYCTFQSEYWWLNLYLLFRFHKHISIILTVNILFIIIIRNLIFLLIYAQYLILLFFKFKSIPTQMPIYCSDPTFWDFRRRSNFQHSVIDYLVLIFLIHYFVIH